MTFPKKVKGRFAGGLSANQNKIVCSNIITFPPRAFNPRPCCGGPLSLGHECFHFFAIRNRIERYRTALAGKHGL